MDVPTTGVGKVETRSDLVARMLPIGGTVRFWAPNERNRAPGVIRYAKREIAAAGHPPDHLDLFAGWWGNRGKEQSPNTATRGINPGFVEVGSLPILK